MEFVNRRVYPGLGTIINESIKWGGCESGFGSGKEKLAGLGTVDGVGLGAEPAGFR